MENVFNKVEISAIAQTIISKFKVLNGNRYVGIRRYRNKANELANYVVNVDFSFKNAMATAIAILKSLTDVDFTAMAVKYNVNNEGGTEYSNLEGGRVYLETGKLPKEGTEARKKVLASIKVTKTLATIRDEMVQQMIDNLNPDTRSNQSKAQRESYTHIENGIKALNDENGKPTDKIYIHALYDWKKVIEEGEYEESGHNLEGWQKLAIERYCKDVLNKRLPTTKFRYFVVSSDQMSEVRINGESVEVVE
jgi:hypothetical protein